MCFYMSLPATRGHSANHRKTMICFVVVDCILSLLLDYLLFDSSIINLDIITTLTQLQNLIIDLEISSIRPTACSLSIVALAVLGSSQFYLNFEISFHFSWAPKSLRAETTIMKLKDACSLEEKLRQT